MREFGLIGYPLLHSFSQVYFTEKFEKLSINNAKYRLYPISEITKIKNIILSHQNLCGLNVTIPYKELVIPFLNELDPIALKLGNVNTISISRNNNSYFLKGYNTDIYGFERLLKTNKLLKKIKKALIIGTGGSAKTVAYVFQSNNIEFTFVSRNPSNHRQIGYSDITKEVIKNHNIIVNTSPVGMYPYVKNAPNIPYQFISKDHFCIDLIYNPSKTLFMSKCEEKKAITINGLPMFYEQADKAWEIWNS